jgi:glucosamine--fructose-6-phosphate aminotransferase (isomerizing)
MCGIFGGVLGASSTLREAPALERCLRELFSLSESRGKEAAGVALATADELVIYKAATPARAMIKAPGYRALLRDVTGTGQPSSLAFIGHSRLVTDGGKEQNKNNQPVSSHGIAGIHNGIVVNHAALWRRHPHLRRQHEVDSEVIFALLGDQLGRGAGLAAAARMTFAELDGAASVAALFSDRDALLLATNNGSLYYRALPSAAALVFASESYILEQFGRRHEELGAAETVHVRAGEGRVVCLQTLVATPFALPAGRGPEGRGTAEREPTRERPRDEATPALSLDPGVRAKARTFLDRALPDPRAAPLPRSAAPFDVEKHLARHPYVSMRDRLRRCTRCVLPQTMPFVDFDAQGVCAYCRAHQPIHVRGHEALEALVAPHRRGDGRPDCLVGVSGGRDSLFGLHYLKTVLGMTPVAYTYDWGMVTDLARRNVSRICGRLGVEHILVSADIPQKRENIRKNVEAWLARPSLGTIPLFMAGDKAYFHHLNQARQQLGVKLAFLCENLLERTDFKTGFAGVPPVIFDRDHVYTLPVRHKLDLARFYGQAFLTNPRYINRSMYDTAKAFLYYYVMKRDYHNLYGYVPWDEATIGTTLLEQYDFERAEDTESLWRIGDGTAPFYNYIYHSLAGLTENDTFRSNQIRNGALTRSQALDLIERDNRPRFPSIQWYLKTIGLDRSLSEVLETIERAPKLYEPVSRARPT